MQMNRRDAIKTISIGTAALAAAPWSAFAESAPLAAPASLTYPFTLPDLPYAYDALSAFIDSETMTLHHTKHHAGYVTNLNKALETAPELQSKTLHDLLVHLDHLPDSVKTAVRNHGGGHANHSLFWKILNPGTPHEPDGKLHELINESFGAYEACIEQLRKSAMSVFGSGWAWLSLADGKLVVESTPNQDSPITLGHTPLLGLDVWEHAYYLRYQNRRVEYVNALLGQINWTEVSAQIPA